MSVKKLSVKKNKTGHLKIHKQGSKDAEKQTEPETGTEAETQQPKKKIKKKPSPKVEKVADGGDGKPVDKIGANVTAKIDLETDDAEHHEDVDLGEVQVSKHMANVGFSISRSINMGDFESLKMQVSINIPSEVDEDEIEDNYQFAKGWVEQKMNALAQEYVGEDEDDD